VPGGTSKLLEDYRRRQQKSQVPHSYVISWKVPSGSRKSFKTFKQGLTDLLSQKYLVKRFYVKERERKNLNKDNRNG
jgi:hypothetical protein